MSAEVGYKNMTDEQKQMIAWAAFMSHVYHAEWSKLVTTIGGKKTSQDAINEELTYIEYRKWDGIVSKLRSSAINA